ncbi:zinc finger, BED-type [Artemisia annua]|uniref:Zinc finger, BED-type n=1 Tax=Artemisia annua TaxID=35608 RepID=A0A2U1LNF2_ARTAN|nr:zinc finger, BED-type [Artemisia annua]
MEPSGSEASEARSIDKGSENVNEHVNENIDEGVNERVDEKKKSKVVGNHLCGIIFRSSKRVLPQLHVLIVVRSLQQSPSRMPATMGESGGSLVSHSFNQERCRQAVARMCIKDNRPFSIVEDEGFQELMLELTEHDYTSYFYNETEDGDEGTRMMRKTKKKKKNVVAVPNEDVWSNAS